MSAQFSLPEPARRALAVLEEAGYEAWIVGGWVRDALLGLPDHDIDICSSALVSEAEHAFAQAGIPVHETGAQHGTITAVVAGTPIEVTTFRTEGTYSDLRHPDEVHFVRDVREDLARRDFTINAMAYHPERGLLDPYGGQADLKAGIIRCVGVASERFSEDALRVLRAVRFACRMGFVVEEATQAALEAAASQLSHIAHERIGQEMDGILASGRGAWALMHERAAMSAAIPELAPLYGFDQHSRYHVFDVAEHTAHVMAAAEALMGSVLPPHLRWATLLHDVAKPVCFTLDTRGAGHFYGHPNVGADMTEDIMRRFGLAWSCIRPAAALVRYHDATLTSDGRSLRRMLARMDEIAPGAAPALVHELLALKRADALGKAQGYTSYAVALDEVECALWQQVHAHPALAVRDLAIGGNDVCAALGIVPGPAVGVVLHELLDEVMAGKLANEHEKLLSASRAIYARLQSIDLRG